MKQFVLFLVICVVLDVTFGLPVTKIEEKKKDDGEEHQGDDVEGVLEYERYLKEVVNALESDPDFRQKLDNASEVDVRSGKIAHELEYVNHHVRTKLDEIKRREMERLRLLAIKQYELTNDIDREHLKISEHEHVDHDNQHTFEIEDLKKLILKTSQDLAEADKQRRQEFKEYELQKEFEKQETLKELDEDHRKKYEEDLKKQQQKHNNHERVHHPGNKAQLEEVWEKQDHMDAADFDPKAFFMLHDLDGNNFWDETEVKALFIKELDKVYQSGLPEDDMRERVEEMERMREHVFREADTNRDDLISFDEFIEQTKRDEFQRDPGWETVDNKPQFTHEEYVEFERKRQEEIQRLIAQGVLPAHPNMPNGYYGNQHGGGYQGHPNEIPGGYQGQPPPQQQLHYQQQQAIHQQQQQQYHQQQQQYQQHPQYQQQQYQPQQQQHHQQQQYPQPVQMNPNQVYQHVPSPNIQLNQPNLPPSVGQPQQPQQQQQQKQHIPLQQQQQQVPVQPAGSQPNQAQQQPLPPVQQQSQQQLPPQGTLNQGEVQPNSQPTHGGSINAQQKQPDVKQNAINPDPSAKN